MGTTTKSLRQLIDHIDNNELVLPEIQRDFVWKKKDVLLLFDSLYRGLPIGFMLVWKTKNAVKTKIEIGQSIASFYGYLLDGQQRLTAIKLVRDGDKDYQLVFSLLPETQQDPDVKRFHYRARRNDNPLFIPVTDVLSDEFKPLQFVEQLRGVDEFEYDNNAEKVLAALTRLHGIKDYMIGLIEFEGDDYRKATELFIRFNSTGKKLNRSDLAAAELALIVPSLVSNGVDKYSSMYSPKFTFTKPFLIQCLTAIHTGGMNFQKPRDIWDGDDEKSIKNSWRKTEKGLSRTIEFLTGTVKWDSVNWLPSINSIIPIVYILSNERFTGEERIQARNWLLKANLHAIFSGAVHSELDRILRGLKRDCSIQKLWNLTKRNFRKITPDDFETRRKSGSAMSLFISILRNENAKDWINNTPLDGNVIGHNAEIQVHHFFPRALMQSSGYKSELINTFANYTIISKDANLDISAEEPEQYLKRLKIKRKYLHSQCIPPNESLWRIVNYKNFLKERRMLLSKKANEFLRVSL